MITVHRPGDGTEHTHRRLLFNRREPHLVEGSRPAADIAVVAVEDGELAGWLGVVEAPAGVYYGAGTWVGRKWRQRGLALALWRRLLDELPDATFEISAFTAGGVALLRAVNDPRVTWEDQSG